MTERRLIIVHLSDLHLSQFGERVTAGALFRGQLPRRGLVSRVEWEDFEHLDGWIIQRWTKLRRVATQSMGLRLLDPSGVRHDRDAIPPGPGHSRRVEESLERMRTLVRVRSSASLQNLCSRGLDAEERTHLLRLDEGNTNLRFLETMDEVRRIGPDVIVITGDQTDDGEGHELVLHTLKDYIREGRFFAVAGNHDLSAIPPGTSHNVPLDEKANRWAAFLAAAGLEAEHHGASSAVFDDVFLLGLNSSVVPSRLAFSGRGRVGQRQLAVAAHLIERVKNPKARICCLHHHVAHLRLGPIARADPGQFAMKLRDAREVLSLLEGNNFSAVLNGHRHHGYHVQEGELPHVVSSPSSTLGCRASGARYFWILSVGESILRVDRHYLDQKGQRE